MKNSSKMVEVAEIISHLSKDTTKIGAVVVSEDGRILGTGFNGYPPGYDDADFSDKYDKVIHAEMNAIINSSCGRGEIHAIAIYGLPPCPDCMKHLAAYGVKEIAFKVDNSIKSSSEWVKKFESKHHLHSFKLEQI